jgi:hypothetical protein
LCKQFSVEDPEVTVRLITLLLVITLDPFAVLLTMAAARCSTRGAVRRQEMTDIPWLAWTNEYYMSDGDMIFDPSTGRLMFSEGIGLWWTNNPPASASSVVWTSQSIGFASRRSADRSLLGPPRFRLGKSRDVSVDTWT